MAREADGELADGVEGAGYEQGARPRARCEAFRQGDEPQIRGRGAFLPQQQVVDDHHGQNHREDDLEEGGDEDEEAA